jgi:FkbM family methyltransferase
VNGLDHAAFDAALADAAVSLDVIRPRLASLQGAREVLIYTYGARGSDLARQLRGAGVRCVIYDNSLAAVARAEADDFETTLDLTLDLPLIIAAGQNQIEIFSGLTRPAYGLAEALYAFDLRNSYGEARAFTDRIVPDADRLFPIYRRMDAACRPAFLDVLLFRASLQIERLVHRRPVGEMWTPPVAGLDIRSFCDLGAYDGDSLAATKALFPRLERSFTIEPSAAQAPVIAAVAGRIGVRNSNFVGAAWDRRTRLGAQTLPNGMMVLDESLDGDIQTETLDLLLGDEPYDYLKLDVEGSEARVLSGGVRALGRSKCVAVAGYHLPNDLYDLPNHFNTLIGDQAADWGLAFGHYSQSFEDSFFFFHRA